MTASTAASPRPSREDDLQRVAQALLRARQGGEGADAVSLAPLLATADDAYRVQALVLRELQGDSPAPLAWKSGGASRESVLTHAPLPAAGVWPSPADAGRHPFRLRLVEAEIALRLARDVTPAEAAALSPEAAGGLVDAMAVSIEIVDSRWRQGTDVSALAKLADFQVHGALVLGEWQPWAPRDWQAQRCTVRIGSGQAQAFQGTHSLQDPAWLLPTWLRHLTRHGAVAPRGSVVSTGTWCGILRAAAGDAVQVEFEGVGAAAVQL